jgi:uncharacterized protein YbaR (Trm112 family)
MDLLACPICKHYPLQLYIYEENTEIIEGLLLCEQCYRWYPILDEIPYMLPDELRDGKDDLTFMEKWKTKLPLSVLQKGKPFNQSNLENP